ncbi:hypothetical protein EJB05_08935, partial [Eragrostis curvula]
MAAAVEASDERRLAVRVVSRRLVRASDPSMEPHVASVSNLDLYAGNEQLATVCLYPKLPEDRHFSDVVDTFETGLPCLLNHLYPLAGRTSTNSRTGLPEMDCNNQGAELIVGEVDVALQKMLLPFPEDVLLSVQLLSFSCGRFAVDVVRDRPADGDDRQAEPRPVGPRDPPSRSAKLDELLTTYEEHRLVNALTAHDSFVDRLYYIEATDIARLRETASTEDGSGAPRGCRRCPRTCGRRSPAWWPRPACAARSVAAWAGG